MARTVLRAARASRPRAIKLLVVCGIALIAATMLVTGALVIHFRNHDLADGERELTNTALILAEQADRTFEAIKLVQTSLVERMKSLGIESDEGFERLMSGHDVHLMLKDKISGLPHVGAVVLIGADGRLLNFSRYWPIPEINVADRSYFKSLASDPKAVSLVSEPVQNRAAGTWTVSLVRRLSASDGRFLGVIMGAVELRYLEEFFGSIALGQGSSITLMRDDGMLLARHPRIGHALGQKFTGGIEALGDRASVTIRAVSEMTHTDRLLAFRRLPHYPLFIGVGADIETILARWQRQSILLLGAGTIVALVICLIVFIAAREIVRGTERSKHSLRDQKRKLDAALNHMSQGLCMFDPAARLVLCNARYLQMYDLSPDAITPDCMLHDLLERRKAAGSFSGDVQTYVSELSASIAQGKEARRLSESSGGRIIEIVNQPMAGGGWIATHNDITQQRRVERERDRNREFLNAVIENVPTTIFVRDARERRYLLVNRSAESMWGMPREKIIGRTPRDLFPEKIADMIATHDDSLLRSNTELLVEEHELHMRNNGTRLIKAKRISIRSEGGEPQYLLGMLEDVTESRAVEQQLQQSQKMEAVGNLTGGLAHDFNNLLTVMIGNLDLLQSELAGNRAAEQKVATILQAAERGADLTHQLLAFSRRQHLSPRHIDVNDLISNTTRLLGRTLGENIAFDLRLVDDRWPVIADAGQLEAALVNIAINARDAMPDGGVLTIISDKSHLDADYSAHHPEVRAGDYVKIELRDTGAGMAPDVLARIFEPFFTTKAPGKGTGLGLSMVYGFMKQSGGHLSAESKVGEGTTFKLYLPRAAGAGANSAGHEAHAAAPAADGKVILVVDDNPAVRATVLLQLKALGYSVYEADNALSALTVLDDVEQIDLLFTDIVMPGAMNGRELAAKARARRPDLKVLYTSGFPGAFAGDGADDRDALLNKPYRRHDLANAIHRVLQTGS